MILDVEKPIFVVGYPNELIQCFMNIFNNAKDALKNSQEENKIISIWTTLDDEDITINFQDNAGGIKESIIDKIFEPYFTTKHQSQGTGLGLHMTYNLIVNGMNGEILASNKTFQHQGKNYKGALFTIVLKSMQKN